MSAFLFAVEPEQSIFVGRLCSIPDDASEIVVEKLIAHYQKLVGDDYVIFKSNERPEFLPYCKSAQNADVPVFKFTGFEKRESFIEAIGKKAAKRMLKPHSAD